MKLIEKLKKLQKKLTIYKLLNKTRSGDYFIYDLMLTVSYDIKDIDVYFSYIRGTKHCNIQTKSEPSSNIFQFVNEIYKFLEINDIEVTL